MKKRILATVLLLSTSVTTFAEQPAANECREIFSSGKFYVEYQDKYVSCTLGEDNGKRMIRTSFNMPGWTMVLNPFGALFGGGGSKFPEAMYQGGKYYQFSEKKKAKVLDENQLNNENLNPKEGWNAIKYKLALPDELAIFYWNDPYRANLKSMNPPQFVETVKRKIGKKEYECDKYVSPVKNAAGGTNAEIVYFVGYEAGKLAKIETIAIKDSVEYPINRLTIKKLEKSIPENGFVVDGETELFAAGIGDMNDLLEQSVKIGTFAGGVAQ